MKLRSFAHSDIGRVRPENEDSFLCNDAQQLFAVADGIGGLPSGAQASQLVVATLDKLITNHPEGTKLDYAQVMIEVNEQVFRLGRTLSPQFGIGSTLSFAHVVGVKLHLGHVGDSSIFRLRARALEKLSIDHNIETELRARTARGEPLGLLMENRNALTRCIGQPPPLEPDYYTHTILPHDRYLLCSDGITHFVDLTEIGGILNGAAEPADAVHQLIDLANERGGMDNSTAVALFCE